MERLALVTGATGTWVGAWRRAWNATAIVERLPVLYRRLDDRRVAPQRENPLQPGEGGVRIATERKRRDPVLLVCSLACNAVWG